MSISSFNKLGGPGREILQVSLLLVAKTASGVLQAGCAGCTSKHTASSSSHQEAAGTGLASQHHYFYGALGKRLPSPPSPGHVLLHSHFPGRPPRWLLAPAWTWTTRVQSPTHGEESGPIQPMLPGSPVVGCVGEKRDTVPSDGGCVGQKTLGQGPAPPGSR